MPPPLDLLPHLVRGLGVTLLITIGGALLAMVSAFTAGLSRLSVDPIVRGCAKIYVEVFRGTSALVQLFWFYFALPLLLGIHLNAILAGILVLGLNIGAYGAEVVRSAIQSVPEGQIRAAYALNLTRWQTLRKILLPQAVPLMVPPLGNLLIELLKSTALVSMITVADLTRSGLFLRDQTLRTLEIFGLLLVIYFLLSQVLAFGMRQLEKRYTKHREVPG